MDKPGCKPADAGPARDSKGRLLPGHSGNPGGTSRARRKAVQDWESYVAQTDPETGTTRRQRILDVYYATVVSGLDFPTLRDAVARILGPVPQRVEVGDGHVRIAYVNDWRKAHSDPDAAPWDAPGAVEPAADEPGSRGPEVA